MYEGVCIHIILHFIIGTVFAIKKSVIMVLKKRNYAVFYLTNWVLFVKMRKMENNKVGDTDKPEIVLMGEASSILIAYLLRNEVDIALSMNDFGCLKRLFIDVIGRTPIKD